jgi:Fe-S-cluster-containing dehydrogenase component
MAKQMGLVANLELCVGCFACEVACKQEHNPG